MVGHKGKGKGTRKGNTRRELPCQEVDHEDRKGAKDERDDPKVSFGFFEGVKDMGEDEEEGRVKVCGVLFVEFYLSFEIIS